MEKIRKQPWPTKQDELVRRYCREAEEILEAAVDYPTAARMGESLCARFQEECESELVVSATRKFIHNLLKRRWGAGTHGAAGTVNHDLAHHLKGDR